MCIVRARSVSVSKPIVYWEFHKNIRDELCSNHHHIKFLFRVLSIVIFALVTATSQVKSFDSRSFSAAHSIRGTSCIEEKFIGLKKNFLFPFFYICISCSFAGRKKFSFKFWQWCRFLVSCNRIFRAFRS